jgi:hypothetical protein
LTSKTPARSKRKVDAEKNRQWRRASYRKHNDVKMTDCRRGMKARLQKTPTVTMVCDGRRTSSVPHNIVALAKVLQRGNKIIYRWIAEGRFPPPRWTIIADDAEKHKSEMNPKGKYYTVAEVEVLARVMGKHQTKFAYYQAHHTETQEELFEEFSKV